MDQLDQSLRIAIIGTAAFIAGIGFTLKFMKFHVGHFYDLGREHGYDEGYQDGVKRGVDQ